MKYFIFWSILTILYTSNADADNFVWQFHDNHFYDETGGLGPGSVQAGFLTAVSDIHHTYTFDTKSCLLTQTEWLSDGAGGQYPAPYNSQFNYTNVYLNDPHLDTNILLFETVNDFLVSVRQQATTDVTTMINSIVNQIHATNINEQELYTITEETVNDIFNGADITSLDIYKNLQRQITVLSQRNANISAIANAINNTSNINQHKKLTAIKLQLDYYLYSNISEYHKLLNKLTPNSPTTAITTTQNVLSSINNQISTRVSSLRGHFGGDTPKKTGVWAQGLTNHSKKTDNSEFTSNTFGLITGIDKRFDNGIILGLGFIHNITKATEGDKKTDSTGNTIFAYGEFRPTDEWYINTVLSSGVFSYTNDTNVVTSDYTTYNVGINLTTGYDWDNGFSVFGGTRYFSISQSAYTDSIDQHIDNNNLSVLTLTTGGRYSTSFLPGFITNLRVNTLYDVFQPNNKTNVYLAGVSYQINDENLKPFGIETGIALNLYDDNWNFDIGYDLKWRNNFVSHTSHIKVKYNF